MSRETESRRNSLEDLSEIIRKAEEEEMPDGEFSEKEEQALCKALLWNMEQAVSVHRLLYNDSGKAADFLCEKVNPAFEHVSGISPKHIVGKKGSDLFGKAIPYFDIFVRAAETGRKIRFKAYYPQIGKFFDMWAFSPEWGRFALLFTDATCSVLAEREHHLDQCFLGGIMDSVGFWLMVFDDRRNMLFWNRTAERLSGYCSEEALSPAGPILEKLFPDQAGRESVLEQMERMACSAEDSPEELKTEVAVRGGTLTIAWTCTPWKSGEEGQSGIIAAGRPVAGNRSA
ncbi:MAG: PAS domain S-box protein [Synergistaceae bacterium]|nr:PAS domain S-box protein [Synergistaceae bacterium]